MKIPDAEAISCRNSTWLVSDSRDRGLTEDEKAALAKHIRECGLCQGASAQFDVLFRQLGRYLAGEDRDDGAA